MIFLTGAAGFIGYHVATRLLERGEEVLALDNLNPYYDPKLKLARLARISGKNGFSFIEGDIADGALIDKIFAERRPARVIHLAAQAGVRYSLENPRAYVDSNLVGFSNVLDAAKRNECEHFVYASSSSVYGGNEKLPFSANDPVDHPVSLYAATKRANELVAHSYSHLFGLPTTGLRFFTVYGPWGRPDMALFKFTRAVLANEPVDVYADGVLERDFTYVDDIAEAVVRLAYVEPKSNPDWKRQTPTPCSSWAPFRTLNVGNQTPVPVNRLLQLVEQATGKSARRNSMPIQPGDVPATAADIGMLKELIDFSPATSLDVGVSRFVAWYREYFGI